MDEAREHLWLGFCLLVSGLLLSYAVLGWQDDVDRQPVHWSAILTTVGALVAAVGVFFVWQSVRESERSRNEAEKTRHATTAADISRRWDEDGMLASRNLIRAKHNAGTLTRDFIRGSEEDATDEQRKQYVILQIAPNYLEDVVILLNLKALDPVFVEESLGAVIRDHWLMWEEPANAWADRARRDPWPNFRAFAGGDPWTPPTGAEEAVNQ